MALKAKAVERLLKFTKKEDDHGVYRYVMKPGRYFWSVLSQICGPRCEKNDE